jgi:uridine nucleosidase
VFDIPSPPLHDPLAVAAVLMGTPHEIPFYDWDSRPAKTAHSLLSSPPSSSSSSSPPPPPPSDQRERFSVRVVCEGTHEEAARTQAAGGPQTGRTIAEKVAPGQPGVRIPRGLDVRRFWDVLEECMVRADEENARREKEKKGEDEVVVAAAA